MLLSALAPLLLAAATPATSITPIHLESRPGLTRFDSGALSEPYSTDLKESARRFLAGRKDLGLPQTSTLVNPQIFGTRFGASVRFTQTIAGVEVDGARAVVTFDADKRVIQVASSIESYTNVTGFTLTSDQAMKIVARAVEGTLLKADGSPYGGTKKMYFVRNGEARAGYLVLAPTLDNSKNWYVGVDAATGAVLFKQDRSLHVTNPFNANVYAPSPGGKDAGVGVTPTTTVQLSHVNGQNDGGFNDGGFLNGTQFIAWNCCTTEGCSPDGGPKRVQGTYQFGSSQIPYDVAVCDRVQRATNDPAAHVSGDYAYTPIDPPNPVCGGQGCTVRVHDPADEDQFAEVHAYHHVNNVYDFVRTLSQSSKTLYPSENIQPFQLRDAANGKVPSVWTNALLPNQQEAFSSLFSGSSVARANTMVHLDNAAFMPFEQMDSIGLPASYMFQTDALVIWQGDKADFAYDAPVLWHEFGHGMLYTAPGLKFDTVTFDDKSANNEGGALHEGLADYLAAAYGQDSRIGQYVGVRIDTTGAPAGSTTGSALRDLDNSLKCPGVLWGEVHQDSQHVSGALWQARKELFQGNDQGRTFDAVVYAAVVSMTPNADFAMLAAAVGTHIQSAFPNVQQAQQKLSAVFDSRGVTNCSKALDITGVAAPQRQVFFIQDGQAAGLSANALVPGPFQFKFQVPNGAKAVSVTFPLQQGFQGTVLPTVQLMAKSGSTVTFTKSGTSLSSDTAGVAATKSGQTQGVATANIDVPCGGELYVALAGAQGPQLQNLSFTVTPADVCAVPDAGTPDAGAGTPTQLPAITENGKGSGGPAVTGCGCGATDASVFGFALMAVVAAAARRRRS